MLEIPVSKKLTLIRSHILEIEVSSEAEALYVLVHGKRKIIISCKLEKLLYGYRMI